MEKNGHTVSTIIYLKVSDEEGIKRLSSRRTCEKCGEVYNLITNPPSKGKCICGGKLTQRDDDKSETIKGRLNTFHKMTSPILELAKKERLLIEINGEREIDVIFTDILSRVEKIRDEK